MRDELSFPYYIFGLRIRSNFPLPGLEAIRGPSDDADVRLHFGLAPAIAEQKHAAADELFFASTIQTEAGEPMQRIWKMANGAMWRIDYADGTHFWLDVKGREVWSCWTETSSFEDAVSYVLGPVLGILLRLRGVTCLHASAVQCGARAAAFAGPGGAGKSTLAAALAMRGHEVISDDVVALIERDGAFYVAPAYAYLCLWPESVQALYGAGRDFAPFSPNFPKRMLTPGAGELKFAEEPAALDRVFLLEERSADASAPFIEHMEQRQALMWLVGNTYANLLLDERMRAEEFALLGRLLGSVPARRVRAHEDTSRISALCEMIEDELEAQGSPAAPVTA